MGLRSQRCARVVPRTARAIQRLSRLPPPSQVAENALTGALTAVAAGTFLHVGLIEVAQRELAKAEHVCGSMLMLLLGFSLMALLALWV